MERQVGNEVPTTFLTWKSPDSSLQVCRWGDPPPQHFPSQPQGTAISISGNRLLAA